MGIKSKRKEITNAILGILEDELPDVTWSEYFKGFQRGKGVVGSVVSDRIDFVYDAKDQLVANAKYTIIIADSENTDTVDDIADEIFELLDDDDLNGKATIGEVKSIMYASAPNRQEAGAVLIIYEVKYYV